MDISSFLKNLSWYKCSTWQGFGIRALRLLERVRRDEDAEAALSSLCDELLDQGCQASAAAPTATVLCEMLPELAPHIQVKSMELLVDLALGFEDHQLGGPDMRSTYRDPQTLAALEAKADTFLLLLKNSNSEVRKSAARILCWLPNVAERSLNLIRDLANSEMESEKLTATVALGILKDRDLEICEDSEILLYASNAAYCETHPIGERNLKIFLQLAEWTERQEEKDVLIEPFDFTLPLYGASVLERCDEQTLSQFRERAVPGVFVYLLGN